jgi:hypothetical protein
MFWEGIGSKRNKARPGHRQKHDTAVCRLRGAAKQGVQRPILAVEKIKHFRSNQYNPRAARCSQNFKLPNDG